MREKLDIILVNKEIIGDLKLDAIICQANCDLEMEDEITSILMKKGGEKIEEECSQIVKETKEEGIKKGEAKITSGGNLKVKYLIHAIIKELEEEAQEKDLMLAMENSLKLCKEKGIETVGIPLIGENSGIPMRRAAELIIAELKKHFEKNTSIRKVYLLATNDSTYSAFEEALRYL